MNPIKLALFVLLGCTIISCNKDDDDNPNTTGDQDYKLNITFVMDADADRLDNLGNPATMPAGNAGQNPDFETLGIHFMGLYQDQFTPYANGVTLFSSPTTEEGGDSAIDFENQLFLTDSDDQFSIPLANIAAGTYEYFRSSLGFQKYNITYNLGGASSTNPDWPDGISDDIDVDGTLASFLGFNNYITNYTIANESVTVNGNKLQGYFGLESNGEIAGFSFSEVNEGYAPQTTVPNPINATSPVPAGSCVVTGKFPSALTIPENPTEDINVQVVISINKSFEWEDGNGNNKYEPILGEEVVDMGTRGVFPSVVD